MDDALKGGLIIGIWIGLSFLSMEFIEIPASDAVGIAIITGSFIAAVVITNYIDKSEYGEKSKSRGSYPGPEYTPDWPEISRQVKERDSYECGNCGGTTDLHAHHNVPLSKGGTNNLSNMRTLCSSCHGKLNPHMREPISNLVLLGYYSAIYSTIPCH